MKIYSAQLKGTTTVSTGSNVSLTGSFSGSIAGIDINANNTFTQSASSRLTNIESKSASVDISISNINSVTASNIARLSNLETKSSSVDISITNINSVTASNIARLSNLESKSASVDISISNINQYTGSNNTKWTTLTNVTSSLIAATGSYTTTGSNTFFGTQTFSGSVYIANNLIVQGSSSIQYISASSVSIGTNIVQLNTANPSVRFAGLTMIDSGSVGGSGSFLYDSVQDEFIFVHRGNGTNVTSSHFVTGPETYDSLGNELYLTCNIITKGTGKEHLVDSCIFDNGTTTCIKNNLVGTGTACFASSTQAGGFYANGTTTITTPFDTTTSKVYFDASCINGATLTLISDSTGRTIRLAATTAATYSGKIDINTSEMNIGTNVTLPFSIYTNQCSRVTISSTGITSFTCQVCSPSFNSSASSTLNGLLVSCNVNSNCFTGITVYNGAGAGSEASRAGIAFQAYDWVQSAIWHGRNTAAAFSGALLFGTNPDTTNLTVGGVCTRLKIDNYGIACFSCQTCTPFVVTKGIDVSSGGATNPTDACVGYGMFGYSGVGLGITAGASGGNQGIGFFVCGVERGRWISSGNLGIGTLCPSAKLEVKGSGDGDLFIGRFHAGTAKLIYGYQAASDGYLELRTGADSIVTKLSGYTGTASYFMSKVGIGIANPTRELHIAAPNSTLRVGPDYVVLNGSTDRDYIDIIAGGSQSIIAAPNESFLIVNTGGGGASPCIDIQAGGSGGVRLTNTATSWAGISDIRAKDIIEPVTNAVAKLSNLSTIIYKLKGDETNQRKIGLIAQEVNEVLPEVVDVPINSCVMWGVRYSEIVPVLVKAIQEQQCTINLLKSCIGIV